MKDLTIQSIFLQMIKSVLEATTTTAAKSRNLGSLRIQSPSRCHPQGTLALNVNVIPPISRVGPRTTKYKERMRNTLFGNRPTAPSSQKHNMKFSFLDVRSWEKKVNKFMAGCGQRYGGVCTCGDNCQCLDCPYHGRSEGQTHTPRMDM